jgi:hypothetical protein
MADTSQRKTRYQSRGNNTQAERNRLNASIPQGNEHYGNIQNVIRSENIQYQNTENFSQTETSYYSTAKDVYNESELVLQSLETKKARLSYTVTFASNTYTFTAKTSTISEIIDGTFNNQEFQDKIAYNSTIELFDGFNTSFVAPATSTGSTSIQIQLYDGTFITKTLKQYNGAGTLISVVADDVVLGRKYDIVIIGGEAVLFGVMNASQTVAGIIKTSTTALVNGGIDDTTAVTPLQLNTKMEADFIKTQQRITFSYSSPTVLNYSAGYFIFDDFSGSGFVSAGLINLATNGIGGIDTGSVQANQRYYLHAYRNDTTNAFGVAISLSPTTSIIVGWTRVARVRGAFLLTNASSQIINGIWSNLTFKPLSRLNVVTLSSPTPTVGTFTTNIPTLTIPHNIVIRGRATTGNAGGDFLYCNFGGVAEDLVTNYSTDTYHLQSVGDASRFANYNREIYSTGQFKYQIFSATLARALYFDIEEIKDNIL